MLRDLWSGLCAALGAALFSQAPHFVALYLVALRARLDEIARQVEQATAGAARFGMSLPAYVADRLASPDPKTRQDGTFYRMMVERQQELRDLIEGLAAVEPMAQPLVLPFYADGPTLEGVWQDFAPAVPLGWVGLAWAALGLLVGIALARAGRLLWPGRWRAASR